MSTEPEKEDPEKNPDEDEDHALGNKAERTAFANEVRLRDQKKCTSDPATPVVPRPDVGQVYDPSQHAAAAGNFDAQLAEATRASGPVWLPVENFDATLMGWLHK